MASKRLSNYLISHRKRLGLSQADIAFLLGVKGGAKVCRDERFSRVPTLETALAYVAVFQTPAQELFAGLFQTIEEEVAERAKVLAYRLSRKEPNSQTVHKLEGIARIDSRPPQIA